jgi:hypothetical protein
MVGLNERLGKFGLFILHKGTGMANNFWQSWAKYVATPTNSSNGVYGGTLVNAGFSDSQDIYSAVVFKDKW